MPYRNKEQAREGGKRYREKHKEQERIRKRIWSQNNPEKIKAYRQKHGKKYRENHKEELQKYKEERIKKGLCLECGLPALPNRLFCGLHLSLRRIKIKNYLKNPTNKERNKNNVLNRYYRIKQENKCWGCGMPLNEESRRGIYCVTCADKQSTYY